MSGEVEILPSRDATHPFIVAHWTRSRDSSLLLGSFTDRRKAVRFAEGFAAFYGCELWSADVVGLDRGRA